MIISLHPHARERMEERGVKEAEVMATVSEGEQFPAKFGRTGVRRNFLYNEQWRGRFYATKQVEAYAVHEEDAWQVITVIAKFF
jgi:hypothetical protein